MKKWGITLIVDGGCANNGGPDAKAYGSFAIAHNGKVLRTERVEFHLLSTNNQAEFCIVDVALRRLADGIVTAGKTKVSEVDVRIKTDSALVVGYFSQGWKRKAEGLQMIADRIGEITGQFKTVEFVKVPRAEIVKVLGH